MGEEFIRYLDFIWFIVPLGIVGIWRWLVWVIKKIVALFYKAPVGRVPNGTLAIITPVYNEDPQVFQNALFSWQTNGVPDEIIAVIDYADTRCIELFENFAKENSNARLIVTTTPGKRQALADGIRKARSEFVALVDSDTLWLEPIRKKMLQGFSDKLVGGVSPRQDVFNPDTLARKLFQINLYNRYFVEMPFLDAAGDALTCLSGRTAVYRKAAIIDLLEELVNERFLGSQSISGDDKTLTRLMQQAGWKSKYILGAAVHTPGFSRTIPFLKQTVRWSRNSWRSDLKTVFSPWVWKKNKVLGLYMVDRFIQPFTLLLSPIYFFISLYFGYWGFATLLLVWWLLSRSIKVFGHLKQHPEDLWIMPQYVVFTFVSAIIRIYALMTIGKQGWITRWDPSRMKKNSLAWQSFAYFFIAVIFIGYISLVSAYRIKTVEDGAGLNKTANAISSQPRNISNAELAVMRQDILSDNASNSFGYYAIKSGDVLTILKNKFNLKSISFLGLKGNVPILNPDKISVGQKIAIPSDEMMNVLDANILLANPSQSPSVTFDKISNTIFVKGSGSVTTLTEIKRYLVANSALEQTGEKEWILRSNLYIGKNTTLVVDGREVKYLKLKSDKDRFIWVRSQNGNILISNTKVTSWDESVGQPDRDLADGRSYITAKSSGRMDIVKSEIGYLGYVGMPKRGGPFGGSYGLSWKITSGKLEDNLLTGSVVDSSIHDNYFGIYTFGATSLFIKNNDVFSNVEYGIDPHDDSNNFLIAGNRVYENGNHGIILSKRCFNNRIADNTSYNNRLHGIMLDRNSNNNFVTSNTVYGNVDGIALYDSKNNLISGNLIHNNKQGIRLNNESEFNFIENNKVNDNATGMHVYGGSDNNIVLDNIVRLNKVGLSLQDSVGNIFYGNFKPMDNAKDVNINAELTGNEIKL